MRLLSDIYMSIFGTGTLPEAETLGIRRFFRDLSFGQRPQPLERAREPKIEVSGSIIVLLLIGWGYTAYNM